MSRLAFLAFGLLSATLAVGQQPLVETDLAPAPAAPAAESPYAGDLRTRLRLLGDPGGCRSALAESGLAFDVFATQFYQGVASGGPQQEWAYGGKLDYLINLDGGKLGLWQGLFVNLHGETRFGQSVNEIDGLLAPSNIVMNFPRPAQDITALTGVKITQALSETFALYAGKINTLDEYPLRYAPGLGTNRPGLEGFMNTSLVFNPIVARTLPYAAAGVGGAVVREGEPLFTFTVFDPEERAARGLEDLYSRGVVLVPDLVLRTRLFDLPGVVNLGGTYSNARYRSFDPAAYLNVPVRQLLAAEVRLEDLEGLGPQETGSWAVYCNVYQSLWASGDDEKRHWGVFAQLGLSDGNPNPIRYVANGGIGGRVPFAGRAYDTFGVGFFYLGLSDEFKALSRPLVPQQDEYGVEAFYNCAITPWCRLTGDLQVARPSTRGVDPVVIPCVRLQMLF